MTGRPASAALILFAILSASTGAMLHAGDAPRTPERITRYDLATREDLIFSHLVAPLLAGDVAKWPILGGLAGQLGDWVNKYLDAESIASTITTSMPIDGQPAFGTLDRLVADCARTLDLDKPEVHVRRSHIQAAYAVRAFGRIHLVLTSALLELYEGRPKELRFVIGHELGHVKCGHVELKRKAFGILKAIQAIDAVAVPDKYHNVVPSLGLGRLCTWRRESEISADRAGLLCCGEPGVAYQAMMRLLHGLNPGSKWIDPEAAGFDPEAVIKEFQEWQYRPFVRFVLDLQRQDLEHPYVPERLAALKAWADTGDYRRILGRDAGTTADLLIEIVAIRAFELAPEGATIDPYAIAYDGDRQVLRTVYVPGVRQAAWDGFKATDKAVDQPRGFRDGQPLFFEIWDSDYLDDGFVGGFVIYPDSREAVKDKSGGLMAECRARILWDWKAPTTISRPGYARVRVRFTRRPVPARGGAKAKESR